LRNLFANSPLAIAAALAAVTAVAAVTPAHADAPAPPTPSIQYNGLFDGYYLYQFSNPKSGLLTGFGTAPGSPSATPPVSAVSGFRFYDTRHNTPTLALGELNVWHTAAPGAFGFKTTLGSGDIAVLNGVGGIESRFQSLMQAYGTYSISKSGAGIDFGKFYTPFGYEVTESNANFNETHSVPFSFIPFYNFGLRAYTQSYQGLVLTGYLVQAVYNTTTAGVENDSKKVSFMGNGTWTDPKGKWVVAESLGLGDNKFNLVDGNPSGGPNNKVTVSDTDVTFNLSPKQIIAGDYTYAKTDPNNSTEKNATFNGWAAYYKQTLSPKTSFAVRYSGGDEKSDDLKPINSNNDSLKPWEATVTYEVHPATSFLYRLEYQHSGSNVDQYVDSQGAITKKDQDTLEVAGVFTFG